MRVFVETPQRCVDYLCKEKDCNNCEIKYTCQLTGNEEVLEGYAADYVKQHCVSVETFPGRNCYLCTEETCKHYIPPSGAFVFSGLSTSISNITTGMNTLSNTLSNNHAIWTPLNISPILGTSYDEELDKLKKRHLKRERLSMIIISWLLGIIVGLVMYVIMG
jgi:hypothetical protein